MAYGEALIGNEQKTGQRMKPVYRVILLVLVAIALLSFMLLQFSIDEIAVSGNYIYSDRLVLDACGISVGENLVTVQKARAAGRIMTTLPFVESVHIERLLPHTLVIYIAESDAAFAVSVNGEDYFLVNADGMITEQLLISEVENYPTVTGLEFSYPEVGKSLTECMFEQEKYNIVIDLFSMLTSYGLTGAVRSIDVESEGDISLNYNGRYEVYLGTEEDLAHKISYLAAMMSDWDSGDKGTIDLSFDLDENARFQPD